MPAPKPKKVMLKIMDLRMQGWKMRTIARKLGISKNTSKRYCKIADKLSSGDADTIQQGMEELNRLIGMTEGVNERPMKRRGKFMEQLRNLKKVFNIFGGLNNGRKGAGETQKEE